MRPWRLGVAVAALITLGIAACGPAARVIDAPGGSTTSAAPKRLVGALVGDPWTLSSAIDSGGSGGTRGVPDMEMMLHAGLTDPDPKAQGPIHLQLAEAIPTLENGLWKVLEDGRMETTWRIRPNARWQDGTPVTADDLVFTARVSTDPSLPLRQHAGFAVVESVEALDSRTVLTRWKAPFIEADWMFSYGFALPLPRHLLAEVIEEGPENFARVPYWTSDFVGAGPFRLREFTRSEHLVMVANDDYVLGRPKIDLIEVRFLANPSAYLASFLAGEVDITIGPGLTPEHIAQLRDRWAAGRPLVGPTDSSTMIFPQYVDPGPAIITNVELRRALLHGIDRQAIVDTLLYGLQAVADVSVMNPAQPQYAEIDRTIRHYEFNPGLAAQIIEQLGYSLSPPPLPNPPPRGGREYLPSGVLADSAGQPLALEVRGTEGANEQLALAVAGYWQRLGIAAQPVVIPRPRASDREYRATRPAFEISNASSQSKGIIALHSRQLPNPGNDWTGDNRARYSNPQLDALLDQYFLTIPRLERAQVLGEIARHLSEQVVTLGLIYGIEASAATNRVRNVRAGEPHNTLEWEVAD